jgi:hypothetical protein
MIDHLPTAQAKFWLACYPHCSSGVDKLTWTHIDPATTEVGAGDIVYLYDRTSVPGLVGWAAVTSKKEVERIHDDGDEEGVTPPFNTYMSLDIHGRQMGRLHTRVGATLLSRYEELHSLGQLASVDSPGFELLQANQARVLNAVLASNGCATVPDLATRRVEELFDDLVERAELPVAVVDCWLEIKAYFARHPERLYHLDPRMFEVLVADILKDLGFDTELTSLTRDGGRDIYAYVRTAVTSFLMFVECKRWSPQRKVGIEVVQRIYGAAKAGGADKSMIVTTSFFTKSALLEQRKISTELVLADYRTVKAWLSNYRDDAARANPPMQPTSFAGGCMG